MKRLYYISLTLLLSILFCACTKDVSDKDIKLKIGDASYEAIYTGALENGKPSGKGTITITNFSITLDGATITGKYNGECEAGIPSGNGTLVSDSSDYSFEYEGEWTDGEIKGVGSLKYDKYVVHFVDIDREGNYIGETLDGEASGYGIFKAENDYGEKYTHDGLWENGVPNGYGRRYFENGETDFSGIFTDGEFEPTLINMLYTMANSEGDLSFNLSDEEVKYIEDNSFLFPCDNYPSLSFDLDENLDYKMIEKNEEAYNNSLMIVDPAYVISIEEYEVFDDEKLSMLILEDEDYNIHYVIYPSAAVDVYSGDYVGCVAYPIGFSSYENVGGTKTKCTILLGSFITK